MSYEFALIIHLIGVILGLGGATVSDVLFMKSLKDERITPREESLIKGASWVIWTGISILLISGSIMFWLNWDVLSHQPRTLAHVTIAGVIIANGFILNLFIFPKLTFWSREKEIRPKSPKKTGNYRKIRRIAFTSGALSLSSWWITFILGLGRRFVFPPFSYIQLIGIYLLIVSIAVLVAIAFENFSWHRYLKHHKAQGGADIGL